MLTDHNCTFVANFAEELEHEHFLLFYQQTYTKLINLIIIIIIIAVASQCRNTSLKNKQVCLLHQQLPL